MELRYIKGDATCPQASGVKIIAHVVNTLGKWGKGFVVAVSDRWPETRQKYLDWYRNGPEFDLGAVQFIQVEPYIWVANMVGQQGIRTGSKGPPVRYEAIEKCLEQVRIKAQELGASVHCPKIGAGLAGGRWDLIEPLIQKQLVDHDVDTTVYLFGEEVQ